MTRDEAKTIFLNRGYIEVDGGTYFDGNKWRESVVVISEWLKEEPCTDAINRHTVIDAMYALCDTGETLKENPWRDNPHIDAVIETIEQIPSVQLQQPCEDAISREAVLDIFADNADTTRPYSTAWEKIRELPPVNPQSKIGHWKKMVEVYDLWNNYRMLVPYGYDDAKFGNTPVYVCDCGCELTKNSRFCPDCGAKMIEPQESEVKE